MELSYPEYFDVRENYLELYNLITKDKRFILFRISYATFKKDEIYKIFEVNKEFSYTTTAVTVLIDNRSPASIKNSELGN